MWKQGKQDNEDTKRRKGIRNEVKERYRDKNGLRETR